MQPTRREMMAAMTGVVASALTAGPLLTDAVAGQRTPAPQPLPSPNAPANQNAPVGLDGAEIPVRNGEPTVPPATWAEIKSDAQKLLDLATDFKWQVNRANLTNTLPLLLLQEARSIEKLAKQLQGKVKG
jgi:hypothetical protein